MKGVLILASAAILGALVMLFPIFLLRYSNVETYSARMRGPESELTRWIENVRTYGRMDVGSVPFPWSLIYAGLILVTGLIAAFGTLLFLKKRRNL